MIDHDNWQEQIEPNLDPYESPRESKVTEANATPYRNRFMMILAAALIISVINLADFYFNDSRPASRSLFEYLEVIRGYLSTPMILGGAVTASLGGPIPIVILSAVLTETAFLTALFLGADCFFRYLTRMNWTSKLALLDSLLRRKLW